LNKVIIYYYISSQDPSSLPYCVRTKLSKLVLPKFRGDIMQHHTFLDSFESTVHTNTKVSQTNYLNSLLEGQAQRTIRGLPVTEDNYQAAVNIWNQYFGKPQPIISTYVEKLLQNPVCNRDKPSQLGFVYDKDSVHVGGLEALGVNFS